MRPPRRRPLARAVPLVLVLGLILTACTSDDGTDGGADGQSPSPTASPDGQESPDDGEALPPPGGTVSLNLGGDPTNFDPADAIKVIDYQVMVALYDRVVTLDDEGNPVPYLATSWDQTATSVTLNLRDDATCADGTPVTPTIVRDSIARVADPETNAPQRGDSFGDLEVTVTADDAAGTVTVETDEPFSGLLTGLAGPWMGIVCPTGIEDDEAMTSEAFGSGPFTLEQAVSGDRYVLQRRDDWAWGPGDATATDDGFPETLELRVVENETTAVNLMLTGDLNITQVTEELSRIEGEDLFRVDAEPFGTNFVLFNQDEGRVAEREPVRQALSHLIDRDSLVQVGPETSRKASSFATSAATCFDEGSEDLIPPFDPEMAAQVLEDAGWERNSDGVWEQDGETLSVLLLGIDPFQTDMVEFLFETFRQNGVDVALETDEIGVVVERIFQAGTWDVFIFPSAPTVPNPFANTEWFWGPSRAEGGNNFSHIDNEAFVEAQDAALAAADPDTRCDHWADAQRALLEGYDYKPVTFDVAVWTGSEVRFDLLFSGVVEVATIRRTV